MKSREITRANCKEKMDLRKDIVTDKFRIIANSEIGPTPTRFYFSPAESGNPRNAFLFERKDILRIFFPIDVVERLLKEDIHEAAPTYLLAILGAHNLTTTEFKEGQSTVIVMGVKNKNGGPITDISNTAVNVPIGTLDNEKPLTMNNEDEIVGFEYPPSDGLLQQPFFPTPMEFEFTV